MRAWSAGVVVVAMLGAGPVSAAPVEASAPVESVEPDPAAAEPEATQPEGEPTDPAQAQAEPTPEAEPLPEVEPTPAPVAEPAPPPEPDETPVELEVVADDGLEGRRTLGLGLLIAGSGFVAIGGGTAAAYGVQDGKCGGSCIGGIVVAATGIAGVVVGALLVARHPKTATARRSGRPLARWRPGHGVSF